MELSPNPCCRAAAEKLGVPPSMGILCHSCADYRSYLHFVKYPEGEERYRPPAGFKHMTYGQITGKKGRH